ncbi:MAG TPA: selenocysteine-specific translation elongation factor [Solirubrobacteraceae bacterium]
MRGGPATAPLTLGTAGHIDHGKTALVHALTGVDTDRLPEEQARGMTIDLGFAPLRLPSGRRLSVVDVPGHERFVRTMVAGATGIDLFLMVIAADDGVMPQTREHAAVLAALDVRRGVVAVTKSDLADPDPALLEAADLLPEVPAITVSARTGAGLDELRAALDAVATEVRPRSLVEHGAARLHVDRSFTIRGAGTVVTGTLWAGSIGRGDTLVVLPRGETVRVRGVQVHDEPAERAEAGQRVAVNLTGLAVRDVARGDVLAAPGAGLAPSYVLDAALDVRVDGGTRVHVHHGTREAPARVAALGGRFHQLRLERPLVAARGDRVVLRSVAPPDTLGGGVVLDPRARKHGSTPDALARLAALERGEEIPVPASAPAPAGPAPAPEPAPLAPEARELERLLREAGVEPPIESELGDLARHLPALREAGRAVRVGRALHYHPDALAGIRAAVTRIIESEGSITLARLRDELGTTRKFAQALLEHFDAAKVTLRRPDDSRVLRRRA